MAEGNPELLEYIKDNYCECKFTEMTAYRLTDSIDKLLYHKHQIKKIKDG